MFPRAGILSAAIPEDAPEREHPKRAWIEVALITPAFPSRETARWKRPIQVKRRPSRVSDPRMLRPADRPSGAGVLDIIVYIIIPHRPNSFRIAP